MSQTWGSVINEAAHKKHTGDLQTCIDVGQIMEKVQRDNYIRQRKFIEQTESVSKNLMNWKKENDSDMKTLENQMDLLKKRKEQIRHNSTEMTILANNLRQRLAKIQKSKKEKNQNFGEDEQMQS